MVREGGVGVTGVRPRRRHARRRPPAIAPAGPPSSARSVSPGSTSPSATRSATVAPKPIDVFWNTWSVDGFISEGLQPAELGWGTHERWMPGERPHPRRSRGARHLPRAARGRDARPHVVSVARRAVRLPRDAQRGAVDPRLLHGPRAEVGESSTARPVTTPTTRATTPCCRSTRCSARPGAGRSDASPCRQFVGAGEVGVLIIRPVRSPGADEVESSPMPLRRSDTNASTSSCTALPRQLAVYHPRAATR